MLSALLLPGSLMLKASLLLLAKQVFPAYFFCLHDVMVWRCHAIHFGSLFFVLTSFVHHSYSTPIKSPPAVVEAVIMDILIAVA